MSETELIIYQELVDDLLNEYEEMNLSSLKFVCLYLGLDPEKWPLECVAALGNKTPEEMINNFYDGAVVKVLNCIRWGVYA